LSFCVHNVGKSQVLSWLTLLFSFSLMYPSFI
jgi:hypothetical protein